MRRHLASTIKFLTFFWMLVPAGTPAIASERELNILDMSLEQLQNVVVTDTKIAQSQETVTQKIEIADAARIDRHTDLNRNIAELLIYKSGLFINTLSRNDANWGSFGGLGAKYNGYLLDGLPMDSFVDTMSLDPWIFERIELYKGPASVMYSNYLSMDFAGNETPLAGITNFILKDTIDAPLTRVQLGGGPEGTWRVRFYRQDSRDKVNFFFGGYYEASDYTNYGTQDSWLGILSDPDYTKGKVYGKVTSLFGRDDHKLSFFLHHAENAGNIGRPNRDFDYDYDTINAAYTNQINARLNLQLKAGGRDYDRRWGNDDYPDSLELVNHNGVTQRIFPVDLSLNIGHAGDSVLTAGTDIQLTDYRNYSETNRVASVSNDVSSVSSGIFIQEKWVYRKWILRAGGRFDKTRQSYERINGAPPEKSAREKTWRRANWSVGLRYNASNTVSIYGNAGTSFVVPSAKQIWGTTGDLSSSGQLPNPDLSEETGRGIDLGLEWRPSEELTLGMRWFLNSVNDAIIDNVVSQSPSQTQSVNAGEARSRGSEITAEHRDSDVLTWFANLTYTSSEVRNTLDRDTDGTDIPFVPDLVVNAGLEGSIFSEITVIPYLHMVGQYYDSTSRSGRNEFGSYLTVNLKIKKIFLEKAAYEVSAFLDLNNITDERFEMPWGFRDPGVNFLVGFEADIF